jgi:hypothetical protein
MNKFSYAKQRNTPCNQNAQNWYLFNAIQKYKKSTNPSQKAYYYSIVNYYMNEHANVVLFN